MKTHVLATLRVPTTYGKITKIFILILFLAGDIFGLKILDFFYILDFFFLLTHCRLNELPQTIYWKIPTIYWKILISILGMSGYMIYITEK